jgi:hypothetical protein
VRWPPAWELVSWSNESVVRHWPDSMDVSRGHCWDPLPECGLVIVKCVD